MVRHPRPCLALSTLLPLFACGDDGTAADTTSITSSPSVAGTTSSTSTISTTTPTTGTPGTDSDSPLTTGTSQDPQTGTTAPTSASDTLASTGGSTGEPVCPEGQIVCDGDIAKVCDGMGGFSSETPCDQACAPGLGCALCVPGEGTCEGDTAHTCSDDGMGYEDEVCDPVQGVTCEDGSCVGPCALDSLGSTYIGCDYYAMVTPNVVFWPEMQFAVVVSNVSDEDADVTIGRGAETITVVMVPAKTVEVVILPWVQELKGPGASRVVVDGAYRVRSTRPITLYQYSPLQYQVNGHFSETNDASLLMPTNAYGTETFVVARNTHTGNPGMYSVVAREDATTVTLMPGTTGMFTNAGGGVADNGTGQVVLNAGDVLQVLSRASGGPEPDLADLTGTRVLSDKPVLVIGGHFCTFVPHDVAACDHLEELNLPLANLAKEYFVSDPFIKPPNQVPQLKDRMVRIIATEAATALTYDPPQNNAPTLLAQPGDYAEFITQADFKISADKKIAVAEYMLGQQYGGGTGDPAQTIAVPIDQYRDEIAFHAPVNYESNFANLTAPMDAAIELDGLPVAGFTAIGNTGFGVARVELSNAGDGDHVITGDKPFGVQVYGYGQYTSYWYPGGLDLTLIPQ